ncbi:hypothetical protein BDQ17DRAFT_1336223 [Cyathus striatus]|nr:hypothetical protein BDQ17DRAFT_1336223 [Cyathus striatus]
MNNWCSWRRGDGDGDGGGGDGQQGYELNDLSGRRASNQNTTTPSTSAAQSSNAATRHTHTTSTARATVDPGEFHTDALKYMPAVPYKGPMKIPGHDPAGDDRITNYRNTITAGEGDVTAGYDANDSVTRHRVADVDASTGGDNTADSARGLEIAVTIEAHVGDDNFDASTQVPVGILAGENSEAASFHQATVADGVPNVEATAGVSAGEDNAVKYSITLAKFNPSHVPLLYKCYINGNFPWSHLLNIFP